MDRHRRGRPVGATVRKGEMNGPRFVFFLALLGFFTTSGAFAGAVSPWANLADPVFVRVDTRELPNPVVQALAQDPTGLIWVGTARGLALYDGYHFRSF